MKSTRKTSFRTSASRDIIRAKSARERRAIAVAARRFVPLPFPYGRGPSKELKSFDFNLATIGAGGDGGLTGTFNIKCINTISIGADINQRVGRQITIKSIQMHIQIYYDQDQTVPVFCRFLLVWDKQSNGTLAASTDILVAGDTSSAKNLNNRNRFTILKDQEILLVKGTEASGYSEDFYKRTSLTTTYNAGVAGTYADISQGTLLFCSVGQVGSDYPLTTGFIRIRYSDD